MSAILNQEDIIRVANSLIADFGELAEAEAENRFAKSQYVGRCVTAALGVM